MHNLPVADGGFPAGKSSSCERFPSPETGDPALDPKIGQKKRHSKFQQLNTDQGW